MVTLTAWYVLLVFIDANKFNFYAFNRLKLCCKES